MKSKQGKPLINHSGNTDTRFLWKEMAHILADLFLIVSAGTSNKISKCQKREIKPLYNN